jgi:hypothetical protein
LNLLPHFRQTWNLAKSVKKHVGYDDRRWAQRFLSFLQATVGSIRIAPERFREMMRGAVAVSPSGVFFAHQLALAIYLPSLPARIQNIDWLSYFGCPTLGPSPHRPVAVIGDENASRAPAFQEWSSVCSSIDAISNKPLH